MSIVRNLFQRFSCGCQCLFKVKSNDPNCVLSLKNCFSTASVCFSIETEDTKQFVNQFSRRPVRRALLYVPGHDVRKVTKIPSLQVDCTVLDCEDGVALDKKDEARSKIAEMYDDIAQKSSCEVGVRINAPSSGLAKKDLEILFGKVPYPSCLVVPKIDDHHEITWICDTLRDIVLNAILPKQVPPNVIRIIFQIESARGLIGMKESVEAGIASCAKIRCTSQIDGVIFGSDDFCADLGISRTSEAIELIYARQKILTTAKAYGLQAIDMVYIDYKDTDGLRRQSIEGFKMGFTGKQIIHPHQIQTVQDAFIPEPKKIEWSLELLKAYDESHKGAFTFQGQMIDLPTILQARNIVNIYKHINEQKKTNAE
ncbi:citramalyl-CoA lyase, mitochondrial-like [Clavelina lepadiformis]|uniref:citramalyl-CoA lyase, mitochondrial-like n=1 Tax=Clavelina lepadiformis TaxID=159417 RepID=UPI004041077E